jgi:hypothetical protein
LRKALFYGKRAGRTEYRSYILAEDISKRNCAVGIKTAGNYRAVDEYSKVVAKTVAGYRVAKV